MGLPRHGGSHHRALCLYAFRSGHPPMPTLTAEENRTIAELVALRRPGYSLPGDFYSSELVYRAEVDRIWGRGWLFVGHACEIRNPGDYFTFSVGDDSLILIR